jgi:hypothetical protein
MNLTAFGDVTTPLLEISLLGHDPDDECNKAFRNVGNWWHSDTASHLRRLE